MEDGKKLYTKTWKVLRCLACETLDLYADTLRRLRDPRKPALSSSTASATTVRPFILRVKNSMLIYVKATHIITSSELSPPRESRYTASIKGEPASTGAKSQADESQRMGSFSIKTLRKGHDRSDEPGNRRHNIIHQKRHPVACSSLPHRPLDGRR